MHYLGIAAFLVSMAVTVLVTPLVIRLAHRIGATDQPGGRKVHRMPMPRIGGLAVFSGFAAGMLFAAAAVDRLSLGPELESWHGLAIAAFGLLVVGLIDDVRGLDFRWKFAAQIVAAMFAWGSGLSIQAISHPLGTGPIELGWMSLPFTVLWIVGITNAVNLIDGLDGLASGIALITTSSLAVIALLGGHLGMTAVSVTLAGALVGFLRFNFNPARIFLGDSGSLFLGFVLAVTATRSSQKGPTAVAILVPLLVLGLPLFDTGMAVVRRLHRLRSRGAKADSVLVYVVRNINEVFMPDRGHIHHLLLDAGLSHRVAVMALYVVGALFALAAFCVMMIKNALFGALLAVVLIVAMFGLNLYLSLHLREKGRRRAADEAEPAEPAVRHPVMKPLVSAGQQGRGR